MRARVLGRARTITRRRLTPVIAALLLASAAAVFTHLPGHQSSSRLMVTDNPDGQNAAALSTTTTRSAGGGSGQATSAASGSSAPANTRVHEATPKSGGSALPASSSGGAVSPLPLTRLQLDDAAGDDVYQSDAAAPAPPGTTGDNAGPALDIVHATTACPSSQVQVEFVVGDITKAPNPSGSNAASKAVYVFKMGTSKWTLTYRVDRVPGGDVNVAVTYADNANPGASRTVDNASVALYEDTNTIEADAAMSAIESAAGRPLDLSEPVTTLVETRAQFPYAGGQTTYELLADNATSPDDNGVLRSCG